MGTVYRHHVHSVVPGPVMTSSPAGIDAAVCGTVATGGLPPTSGNSLALAQNVPVALNSNPLTISFFRLIIESSRGKRTSNRARTNPRAAKPPLSLLCSTRAPPEASGRRETARRVLAGKSVARNHAVSPTLDLR